MGKFTLSELLAIYTDKLLRKGGVKVIDTNFEDFIDQVVSLFQYMIDKDLFLEVYRN